MHIPFFFHLFFKVYFQLEDNSFIYCTDFIQQCESVLSMHTSPSSWTSPPHPTPSRPSRVSEHWVELPLYFPFSSVQSLSRVWFFATPWTVARQASQSITNSQSLLKLMSFKSVMPFNHLILCRSLPLSIFPSIRVFSNESVLHIRWPKYWSFSTSSSNEYSGLISFKIDWLHHGILLSH